MMLRSLILVFLIAAVALGASGCGRKASPDHPPGSDYPRRYPAQ